MTAICYCGHITILSLIRVYRGCAETFIHPLYKLEFARLILKKYMKLVCYFKASYQAGKTLRNEIMDNMVSGSGLKEYCQTRWTMAFNCASSVLKCKEVLKNVSINYHSMNSIN